MTSQTSEHADPQQQGSEQTRVILVAVASNFLVAVFKFIVAAISGSSAMISEGIHSLVDTGNEWLLLQGLKASHKSADESHPFGYGQELYFWTLVVAFGIFTVGGGVSFYEGVERFFHPHLIENSKWTYVVLGGSLLIEGYSWRVALREFQAQNQGYTFWQGIRRTKDPATLSVLLEDSAALVGLLIALLGVGLSDQLHQPYFDAAASILIGVLLVFVAILIGYESKELLIGEGSSAQIVGDIRELTLHDPAVKTVVRILTMHLGPQEILLNLDIEFEPELSAAEIASAIERIEQSIRSEHPQVRHLFLEAKAIGAQVSRSTVEEVPSSAES